MGYYDGLAGISPKASAYDVARITKTPAVLIVNAKGMSLSAAAFVKGFVEYREDSQIRGVILNQISPMMYPRLKQIIEETLPVKVYGYVPVVKDCVLESRHLGLVMPEEIADLHNKLMKLAEILESSVDIDGLLELADGAEELPVQEPLTGYHTKRTVRIALAKDEAFCFFYQDNLELLEEMGAQLIPFSPIHDEKLPENIDGMLFHGGYPELYAKALSENKKMLTSVREAVQARYSLYGRMRWFYVSASGDGGHGRTQLANGRCYSRQILAYAPSYQIRLYYPGRRNVFWEECGRNPGP